MKKFLLFLLISSLALLSSVLVSAQNLQPFEGCPGVSVAITRPGFNMNLVPHQIYLIDDTTGAITPSGHPIDLQINGFGLNNEDGFLYGIHEGFNVANPFLARVDKNGDFINVGTILGPPVSQFKVALVNTAAGTMDDKDNFYLTAVVVNLQNVLLPPEIFVGKIEKVSRLHESSSPLQVNYKKVDPGSCILELLNALQNPLLGVMQDIAFNPGNGALYTFLPGIGGTGGKIAWFNPSSANPSFNCITPSVPNTPTADLSGLFFNPDTALIILTTDGKLYKGNATTGQITLITQTTLPLLNNNLRGDMASCLGKKKLHPFDGCPGLALAITRTGINNTGGPFHIYKIKPANGAITPMGHNINLQINAFGLNNKDGFLYGMHEVSNVFGPTLARVDSSGDFVDLDTLAPPPASGNSVGIINTAAATMDARDNYYFTAVVVDTQNRTQLPKLYLGTIRDVSRLNPGDPIHVDYDRIFLGTCLDEILASLANPANGLFQDIAFNPKDGKIYTYIQPGVSPRPGKLASFDPTSRFITLKCITPNSPNPATQDLSGMHADQNGKLFILTIDGKYYRGNPENGKINLVAQTTLPLLANNLRGDMASCVKKLEREHHPPHHGDNDGDDDDDDDDDYGRHASNGLVIDANSSMRVAPNPVNSDEVVVYVTMQEPATVVMKIVDMNGDQIQSNKQVLVKGDNQVRLQVRGLKSGMFAVVMTYPSGQTGTVKFIRL